MTQAEFKELARHLGADLVFNTAPVAVFKGENYTVSVDIDSDKLGELTPLHAADILAEIAMMMDKELR